MTPDGLGTRRPFTVVSCESCSSGSQLSVGLELKESVRRCAHGILVSSVCLRGPLACAAHSHGPGAVVVLQPCGLDRRPVGPAHWIGPIKDRDDVVLVRDWLECGEWDRGALPQRLRHRHTDLAALGRRN